jgi:hypothetical protein
VEIKKYREFEGISDDKDKSVESSDDDVTNKLL